MSRFLTVFTALIILSTISSIKSTAQSTVWTKENFRITQDSVALIKFTDSTELLMVEAGASRLTNFPGNFSFQFGLNRYTNFSVSPKGFLKLGSLIEAIDKINVGEPVIAPLFGPTSYEESCHYSIQGTAPNRKFIVQWTGDLSGWGDMFRYQVILEETTGRIEFRYEAKWGDFNDRKIFCTTPIKGYNNAAGVYYLNDNQPSRSYISQKVESYRHTRVGGGMRFIFQPDNTPLAAPNPAQYSNLNPANFLLNWKATSTRQRLFWLERATTAGKTEQVNLQFKTDTTIMGEELLFHETKKQPNTSYTYYLFSSNGFSVSDTVTIKVTTPMPLINGLVRIPGDYPSMNALIEDAQTKHLGPDLIIELQPGYSYANEGASVHFNAFLQNRFLKSITIRSGSNTPILLENTDHQGPILMVDSIQQFTIDGQNAGVDHGLHFKQRINHFPALAYINNADNGTITNCRIEGVGVSQGNQKGLVYAGPSLKALATATSNGINNFSVVNNKIGQDTGAFVSGIVIEPGGKGHHMTIRNNQLFGFEREAIKFHDAGEAFLVVNNRVFQNSSGTIQLGRHSVISVTAPGNRLRIDSNRIGGNTVNFDDGYWNNGNTPLSVISVSEKYYASNPTKNSSVSYNIITQIKSSEVKPIYISAGDYIFQKNQIGSTDKPNSIEQKDGFIGMDLRGLKKAKILHNTIGGIREETSYMIMIYVTAEDSLLVEGNSIGQSDVSRYSSSLQDASGITLACGGYTVCSNNTIQGIESRKASATAFNFEGHEATSLLMENNRISHIKGKYAAAGIYLNTISYAHNRIIGNTIHTIGTAGPYIDSHSGTMEAFNAAIYVYDGSVPITGSTDKSLTEIAYNKISTLEHDPGRDPGPDHLRTYQQMRGIYMEGGVANIYNNLIHLGLDRNGNPIDTLEAEIMGVELKKMRYIDLHYNTVYLGGNHPYFTWVPVNIHNLNRDKYRGTNISNNIIQNDTKGPASRIHYISMSANGSISHNNIWHSNTDPNIEQKLNTVKTQHNLEINSIVADPQFVRTGGSPFEIDLHVKPGSPADRAGGSGNYRAPLYDLDSNLRKDYSPVDIGAYAVNYCQNTVSSASLFKETSKPIFCKGDTIVLKARVVASSAYTIQWTRDGQAVSVTTDSLLQAVEPGVYRFKVLTECGEESSDSLEIRYTVSNASVSLKSEIAITDFCETTTLPLSVRYAGLSDSSYQLKWYRNNIEQAAQPGFTRFFNKLQPFERFIIELLPQTGCIQSIKDTLQILNILPIQRPSIRVTDMDTLICASDSGSVFYSIQQVNKRVNAGMQLDIPGSASIKQNSTDSVFSLNGFDQSVKFRIYTIPYNDANACIGSDTTAWVTLRKKAAIPKPIVQKDGQKLVSSSPSGNQWFRLINNVRDPISGETSNQLQPAESGQYFVQVTENECVSLISDLVTVELNPSSQRILHYPNPATQFVWLKPSAEAGLSKLLWYNQAGNLVEEQQIDLEKNVPVKITIPLQLKGICYLRVKEKDGKTSLLKIIVQ